MTKEKSILKFSMIRIVILVIPLLAFWNEIFESSNKQSIGGNSGISIPNSLVIAAVFFLFEILLGIEVLILLVKEKYKRAGISFTIGIIGIGLFYFATYLNTII
jgi:hypothetical protein